MAEFPQFELVVTGHDGQELERKPFHTEDQAEAYKATEWGNSDRVASAIVTMVNEDGSRSIFDDVDDDYTGRKYKQCT